MIVYLGTASSNEYIDYCHKKYSKHDVVYVQQKWDYTLVKALLRCYGDDFFCVSYPPIQTFPSGKCLFKKRDTEKNGGLCITHCGLVNLPFLKQVTSILDVVTIIKKEMKKRKDKDLTIITHSFYPQSFRAIKKLKKIYNVKVYTIIPDLPDFAYSNLNKNNKILAWLWENFNESKQKLKKIPDGYICFSKYQRNYLEKDKPYIVMEGFADVDYMESIDPAIIDKGKKIFMYAGALKENYGVDNLIHAFHSLENNDCEL